jgi:glycine/D-amino acid oxidase-like deaminating enzyme
MRAGAVVIGGGTVGTSCFYHLVQRGLRDVVLVEQAGLAAGSSGRSAAVVEAQYLAREKIALCSRSMALFRRFERDHGLPFVHHGYLRLGHSAEDLERFQRSVEIQREYGVADARVLDRAEICRQLPDLYVEDLAGALFGPSDGYIDPVRLCELFVELGKAGGGRTWLGRRVTGIRVRSGQVAGVVSGDGEIACETVVNAAGAWARSVGRLAGVELPVDGYRRQIVILEPPEAFLRPIPMTVDYVPGIEREGLYFRDDTPRRLLAGLHWEGHGDWERPDAADAFRLDADWDYAARVSELLCARYPPASGFKVQGGWAGLYPLTPDSEPIIGETPGLPGFYQAIGAGGVGVQTAPAIGAIVADLVASGRTTVVPSIEGYRLDRFRSAPAG